MRLFHRAHIGIASAIVATLLAIPPAGAQEVSEAHLKAARAAVSAINATGDFDAILPQAAEALKRQLIQQSPDLEQLIDQTVTEKTIALVSRRTDLEKEAATAYAKVFSEADLNAIATFYTSPSGRKLLADGPIVTREVLKAADIWQRGIARDLAQQVAEVLAAKAPKPAGPVTFPAEATSPAEATPPVQPQN